MNISSCWGIIVLIAADSVEALVRRCKCDEDDECRKLALNSVGKCATDCTYVLTPLGGDPQAVVECFGDQKPAVQAEDVCFRRKVDYECDDAHENNIINEMSFDNIEFTLDEPVQSTVSPIIRQIYDNLHMIYQYNYCIRSCYKNITAACYRSKRCGFDLPDRKTLVDYAKNCVGAHSLFYSEQVQACHCLLHKLHLTKLSGTCLYIGNPFMKESRLF